MELKTLCYPRDMQCGTFLRNFASGCDKMITLGSRFIRFVFVLYLLLFFFALVQTDFLGHSNVAGKSFYDSELSSRGLYVTEKLHSCRLFFAITFRCETIWVADKTTLC